MVELKDLRKGEAEEMQGEPEGHRRHVKWMLLLGYEAIILIRSSHFQFSKQDVLLHTLDWIGLDWIWFLVLGENLLQIWWMVDDWGLSSEFLTHFFVGDTETDSLSIGLIGLSIYTHSWAPNLAGKFWFSF